MFGCIFKTSSFPRDINLQYYLFRIFKDFIYIFIIFLAIFNINILIYIVLKIMPTMDIGKICYPQASVIIFIQY